MIVERATHFAKNVQQAKLAEIFREQIDGNTAFTGAYRIYLADIGGPYNAVVIEWEHEDVPAMRAACSTGRSEHSTSSARWTCTACSTGCRTDRPPTRAT